MQILESHAIQDLITAISEFIRHGARGKNKRAKEPHDEREYRHHCKPQWHQKSQRHRRYDDNGHYEGEREPRRHGQQNLDGYHNGPAYGPIFWSSTLTT